MKSRFNKKACISLLLALTMLALPLVSCQKAAVAVPPTVNTVAEKLNAVCEAEYPKYSPYPNELSANFDAEYDAWFESKQNQQSHFGNGENLTPFFKSSIAEFLSNSSDNAVYSPLNVYMALALLAESTDSDSRSEILTLLGYDSIETLREKANAIWQANYSDDGAVTSILANSVWMNDGVTYNMDTLKILADNYYASSFSGQMGSEEYNEALRSWMNEQTGGLLEDLISGIEMSPETVLTLVSTIYFQAKWENEFLASNTKEDTFSTPSGDVTCDFMNKTETYGNYYYTDGFAATNLGLENSGDMWLILPDEGVSVDELLASDKALSFMCGDRSVTDVKTLKVNISIPKFDVNSKTDLVAGLKNLGVKSCFSAVSADFSPIISDDGIWLDKVEHGARVKIDEEGVTAAAYTVMMACGAALPPEEEVDFILDRPFIFVINGSDNLPLFVGVVNNP